MYSQLLFPNISELSKLWNSNNYTSKS